MIILFFFFKRKKKGSLESDFNQHTLEILGKNEEPFEAFEEAVTSFEV